MSRYNPMLALEEVVNKTNKNRTALADQLNQLIYEQLITADTTITEALALLRKETTVQDLLAQSHVEPVHLSEQTIQFTYKPTVWDDNMPRNRNYEVRRNEHGVKEFRMIDSPPELWQDAVNAQYNTGLSPGFKKVLRNALADLG